MNVMGRRILGFFIVSHRKSKFDFKIFENTIIVPLGAYLFAKS
jgi:hypothetical protein